jgi:hypothetical protein
LAEDEAVTRREFDAYKHAAELQRDADTRALQSQVAGLGQAMATHYEDDRRNFGTLRNQLWGLLAAHLVTLGGIVAVLLQKH